jgi:chemotaxis signal transduction protein
MEQFLAFRIEDLLLGIDLNEVDSVLRAVYITPIPEAPSQVLGLVDVRGKMTMILDVRYHLELPRRPIQPSDRLILLILLCQKEAVVTIALSTERYWRPEMPYETSM